MRIKRLEVTGFKSFCDRTVMSFHEPVIGIVGPNGCGKSNIVDAIRWCMGEQSAKHLRGKAMDDVIFAGSDSRGPLGLCEVTLVFENDGQVPLEYLAYSEIAVTRRLHRDGTSEYFLNKTACRLRDVTDFFLGTGVGAKAYSIIEQGRVGMIVSSKPEDRRFLIEEAAGITKYKIKKKAAEKKMEATRHNLLRVSDVVAEIEKQLGSLRRQAQKAERYRQYKAELKDIELWSASLRWLGLIAEERVLTAALAAAAEHKQAAHTRLDAREAELESARLELAEEERRFSEIQEALYQLDNRLRLGEAEVEHFGREVRDLEERARQGAREIELLDAEHELAEAELGRTRAELEAQGAIEAEQAAELAGREQRWRAAKEEMQAAQAEAEGLRGEVAGVRAAIVRAEAEAEAADKRRSELEQRAARLGEEEERLERRERELATELDGLTGRVGELRQLRLDLASEKEQSETRLGQLRQLLAEVTAGLEPLNSELHLKRSRLTSLEGIQSRYEGFARGTRAVMQNQELWGVKRLLADAVESPAEYETAVEAALGERLGAVLVETQEVSAEAVAQLKARGEGRATFVPLDRVPDRAREPEPGAPAPLPEGARGRLLDLVRFGGEAQAVAELLLADVVVVDDLLRALDLWRSGDRRIFVTLEGEVVDRHGVVTGGSREADGAGVLEQKREMRELGERVADLERRHAECVAEQARLKAEMTAVGQSLDGVRHDSHQRELEMLTQEKELARARDELERLRARLGHLAGERRELTAQALKTAEEAASSRAALSASRAQLDACEDRLSALAARAVELFDLVDAAAEASTAVRVQLAQTQEKRLALGQRAARLEADLSEKQARRARLERSLSDGAARQAELGAGIEARRVELNRLAEERSQRNQELAAVRGQAEAKRGQVLEGEGELKGLRAELEALTSELSGLELQHHDGLAARAHLEEQVADRYRLELKSEVHRHHLRPLVGDAEERRLGELRDLIERMGEINLTAIEEYQQLETRYTFLSGQKADLEKALDQLDEAIARINRTSRRRFREVFDLVNAKFQEIFPRCFRGGHARLELTNEENLLESGIEIIAQPPGKKNSTVEVLSGGEKAMTAVALIFAIFLIKPSPFCLLDEVDAPLDEVNVGRFNDLVLEMTDRSQFILITHNKRTMQIVDTLYGVTMEEPGISKLVSVRLSALGKQAPGEKSRRAA